MGVGKLWVNFLAYTILKDINCLQIPMNLSYQSAWQKEIAKELLQNQELNHVMTTRDYDLDTFSFFLSSLTLMTPVFLTQLYHHLSLCPFVPLLSLSLYFYHSLTHTAWPMTHSDDSGCATLLFSDFLVPSIWLIVTHLHIRLWLPYYKYCFSICSRLQLYLCLTLTISLIPWLLSPSVSTWLSRPCLNHQTIETLNPWTHRYLALTPSSVSLSGHNKPCCFIC